ncbi:sulfotransferase [Plakobranchus ocellatus]|uniref:Sulfotransferase n=1 Tax=Plakobranchus ocellatus TaxID=259542 RepID=A0AAV4CHS9_9GAST|nr:sulfotransferase [Plakobranchus ocellatus]
MLSARSWSGRGVALRTKAKERVVGLGNDNAFESSRNKRFLKETPSRPTRAAKQVPNDQPANKDDFDATVGETTQVHQLDNSTVRNKSSLLVVTMGRSGSTFTSAIISHHKDVFYTSEPLHAVGKDIYNEEIS